MRRQASLVALALAGCAPIYYDVLDSDGGDGTTTGSVMPPDPSGPSDPTLPSPTSGVSVGPPPGDTCFDGALDGLESDIDCGGPECPPCQPGLECRWEGDCIHDLCIDGVCGECLDETWCPVADACLTSTCGPDHRCVPIPLEDGSPCEDGDLCSVSDQCFSGSCHPGPVTDCSLFDDACNDSFCNPSTGNCAFEPINENGLCFPGDPCVAEAQCFQGECLGEPLPPLLHEDFSDPLLAWVTDEMWQIGPAFPSQCAELGGEDPAFDHSPSPDEMLAGAVIGGCLPPDPIFLDTCLTSPPMVASAPGPLVLTYWSRLSAAPLKGHARVEVGLAPDLWVSVFDSGAAPVDEPDWTFHEAPLPVEPGLEFRVRFCHALEEPAPAVAGWSVDDITVGPPGCFAQP